jgi:hypothetical protein
LTLVEERRSISLGPFHQLMTTIEEDLTQLEKDVRQFKIEYEQYFGGGRKRPPADTEWRIELVIKRYGDRAAEMSYGDRFRFNNLIQTYAKYREFFRKRFKQREEGYVPRHFGAAARTIDANRAHAHEKPGALEPTGVAVIRVECSDPDRDTEKVEQLYQAFRKAKEKAGESTEQLALDAFRTFLRQKAQQFKEQQGCESLEYEVAVESGRVRLRARVKK